MKHEATSTARRTKLCCYCSNGKIAFLSLSHFYRYSLSLLFHILYLLHARDTFVLHANNESNCKSSVMVVYTWAQVKKKSSVSPPKEPPDIQPMVPLCEHDIAVDHLRAALRREIGVRREEGRLHHVDRAAAIGWRVSVDRHKPLFS